MFPNAHSTLDAVYQSCVLISWRMKSWQAETNLPLTCDIPLTISMSVDSSATCDTQYAPVSERGWYMSPLAGW